jgi:hypothetical protein
LGSLLDESQAVEGMLPQTGSTSRHDKVPVPQVATLCAVRPNGANITDVDAVGECLQLQHAAAPKIEEKEKKDSDLEKDQRAKEHHMDTCEQSEVVKGDKHALVQNDKTNKGYHNSHKIKCFAKVRRRWANTGKRHWQCNRSGSKATESKGTHQGHRRHDNIAGSWRRQGEGGDPLMAFAATQGEPGGADPSMVAAPATLAACARKHSRDAKDPASSGITRTKPTSKRKCAAAAGEIKSITRILPDEMETQPVDINETWFAFLMEPTLDYAEAEHSANLLDTATTLQFAGVVTGFAVQPDNRLQTAPTLFYTPVVPPAQLLRASATLTLDPTPSAAVSLNAAVLDVQDVAML